MREIMETLINQENSRPLKRVDYANSFYRDLGDEGVAIDVLEEMRSKYLKVEGMIKTRGFSSKTVSSGDWARWQKAYPEIISSLVYIYRDTKKLEEAESVLNDWVRRNPTDQNAKDILNEVRSDIKTD